MHFERLKPHQGGPTEFVALPSGSGEVVVVMDPEPEHSAEEIRDDCSQPSYREEEPLSEASDVSLPSRRRHWMDTRLRTRMRAGGSRLHYQQFDYSSSDSERSRSDDLLSDARDHSQEEPPALFEASMPPDEQPQSFEPANDHELPFLSESEVILEVPQSQDIPVATGEAEVSLAGTSAPLLTNPTLTDVPISIPQLPNGTSNLQNTETRDTESSNTNEPTARNNVPSTRGRGRSRAALSRCSTRATNSRSLGGHEDTLFLQGKQLVKMTHSHQFYPILTLMRPPRSLHTMLTKAQRRLTHTMAYAGIEYLDIDVEPVGSAIALVSWL